jgi:hypothetical protein
MGTKVPVSAHTCSILRIITHTHVYTQIVGFTLSVVDIFCEYPQGMSQIGIPRVLFLILKACLFYIPIPRAFVTTSISRAQIQWPIDLNLSSAMSPIFFYRLVLCDCKP